MPKISVIVPVYNAEKWIRKCLDSILSQTFSDFELIVVDDGSPDRSGAICDEYASKDKRIKVIHKTNGGVSSARQCGLDNAKGEYIIHCDPDDWVEKNWLECLYKAAVKENADISICDFWIFYTNSTKIIKTNPSLNAEKLFEQIVYNGWGSLWNKLIKRSLVEKVSAKFPKGVDIGEDMFFCFQTLCGEPKIAYVNSALYCYNKQNDNSITSQGMTDQKSRMFLLLLGYLETLSNRDICSKRIQKAIKTKEIGIISAMLLFSPDAFLKEHRTDITQISLCEALSHRPTRLYFLPVSIFYACNFMPAIKVMRWLYQKMKG